jgi:hypothetical protein
MRRVCTNDLEEVVNKVPNAMSDLRRRPGRLHPLIASSSVSTHFTEVGADPRGRDEYAGS